jgi:hypothetical protein
MTFSTSIHNILTLHLIQARYMTLNCILIICLSLICRRKEIFLLNSWHLTRKIILVSTDLINENIRGSAYNTVTWCLKAGIVEPEMSIVTQRLGKHVSAATDTQETIEELLGTMFSFRSVPSGSKEEFSWEQWVEFRSSKWAVTREMGSAWGGWEDGAVSSGVER